MAGQPAGRYVCWNQVVALYRDQHVFAGVRVDQSLYRALRRTTSPSCPRFRPAGAGARLRKEERPTLVWCARLVPHKPPLDAIEAFEIARRQIPDLQLWMIGGDPTWKVQAAATDGVTVFGRVSEQEKVRSWPRRAHRDQRARRLGSRGHRSGRSRTPTVAYDVPGLRDSTRAADGVAVPPLMALGRWIPTMMKHWRENPVAPQPFGGAHSWDDVAREVFLAAISVLPASARLRLVHDAARS